MLKGIKRLIRCYPIPYRVALSVFRPQAKHLLAQRDTELVVEGYPRSANSYATQAIRHAQGRHCRIASHTHAPAQVIYAIREKLPCLVLIRLPIDAIASYAAYHRADPLEAYRDYLWFYRPLLPHLSGVAVATFDQVTQDFGAVILRLNRKLHTDFRPFDDTSEATQSVLQNIEDRNRQGATGDRLRLSVPHIEKNTNKAAHVSTITKRLGKRRLKSANKLYEQFAQIAQDS